MLAMPTLPEPLDLGLKEFRPNQLETISEAIFAPEKFILIDGPPGCGKSAIAAGIAKYYEQQTYHDLHTGRDLPVKVVISIRTHNLQEQYTNDFRWMERLFGRSNYGCVEGERNAAEGICTISPALCHRAGTNTCEYYAAYNQAVASKTLVVNNDLLVLGNKYGTKPIQDRKILIIDEAHLIDESVRSANGVEISHTLIWAMANKAGIPAPTESHDPKEWKDWCYDIWDANDYLLKEMEQAKKENDTDKVKRLKSQVRGIQAIIDFGTLCLNHSTNPVVIRDVGQSLKVEPIWAARYFQSFARHYDKVIMLSATLPGPSIMAKLLGLQETEYRVIHIPSTFPAAQRPWIVEPVTNVKKGMTHESTDRLVDRIDQYLEQWLPSKGIIHCHSYWLRDAIIQRSRFRPYYITHGPRGIKEAVSQYRRQDTGVLISPTAHTGVDLPYDQCRFQLILKLPAPDMGDPVIDARRKEMPETYDLMIAATLLQTYGRIMRAPDDGGKTVSLDRNLVWWLKKNWNLIPPHVQEAIQFKRAGD